MSYTNVLIMKLEEAAKRRRNKKNSLFARRLGQKENKQKISHKQNGNFFRRRLVNNRCRTGWAVKSEISLKFLIVLVLEYVWVGKNANSQSPELCDVGENQK